MSHVHKHVKPSRLPLYPGNGRVCYLCHGSGWNCPECSGWDEIGDDYDEGDSPYCECGSVHTLDELDWNKCDCCGKEIE